MQMHKFAEMCEEEFIQSDVWPKLDYEWGCVPSDSHYRPKHVYIIKKDLPDYPKGDLGLKDIDKSISYWKTKHAYEQSISNYIEDKIEKLRLIKEGSIKISIEFFYKETQDGREMLSSAESSLFCENRLFALTPEEIKIANRFLSTTPKAKPQKYIQLALENFHLSYQIHHKEFEFLSLMISLETLLNDGKTELRLRVARGCAILLGHDEQSSREVFKLARDLYDKRSVLVHTGDRQKITENDTLLMKDIVRRTLKAALTLNLPKQDLSSILLESGFGSDPVKKIQLLR
ncbi:hypothetical protein [Azotobacter salinestris]|uniref:hypothetical protein n=1 Tax=Azotobacter salinestris TaxID=69964 RepID=UPI0032DFA2C6